METLTPDSKRSLCIHALGLCAHQIASAAEGDLELAELYGLELERTLDLLRGNTAIQEDRLPVWPPASREG